MQQNPSDQAATPPSVLAETPPPLGLKSPFDPMSDAPQYRFKFHGNASEYFGIWIVNIILTIITLSFYSPWAKVRRLRYFYQNTEFFQRRFDFTGIPGKILVGRLIAIGVWIGATSIGYLSPRLAPYGIVILYLAMPWLLRATMRFTSRNSKLGNSRFYFSGTTARVYGQFVLAILITVGTLGLFAPVTVWLYKRYCFNHLYVGQMKFELDNDWFHYMTAIYVPVGIALVMFIVMLVFGIGSLYNESAGGMVGVLVVTYFSLLILVGPLVLARIYIATWNHVRVGNSYFKTECNQWRYSWILATNWLARMISFGLLTPWAAIRLHRYQVESLCLYLEDDPDQMLNMAQKDHNAIAEEIADIFDLDISL